MIPYDENYVPDMRVAEIEVKSEAAKEEARFAKTVKKIKDFVKKALEKMK